MIAIMKWLVIFFILFSETAHAHVKWFVNEQNITHTSQYHLDLYSFLICLGTIVYFVICVQIERVTHRSSALALCLRKSILCSVIPSLLKFSMVVFLLGNLIQHTFIAPNLPPYFGVETMLLVQSGLVVMLVLDVGVFGIALIVLSLGLTYAFGWSLAIDYAIELAAFGLAMFLLTSKRHSLGRLSSFIRQFQIWKHRNGKTLAIKVLRIGLGLQLCIIALNDKLLHPDLALAFLEKHPEFNFVRLIGLTSFQDIHFTLSAGLAEFSFGLLLILNISSRFVAATVLVIFSITGVILGIEELIGHIPIIAAVGAIALNPTPGLMDMSTLKSLLSSPISSTVSKL